MKIQTEKERALLERISALCDAVADTDPEAFMAYVGAKYPAVAVKMFDVMAASIEYEIERL
jgi:hypothetical protein